jgi:hypothetical protein
MKYVAAVDSAWGAQAVHRMSTSGLPASAVVMTSPELRRMWGRLDPDHAVALFDRLDTLPPDPGTVLFVGADGPEWAAETETAYRRIMVTVVAAAPYRLGDPVQWAVLTGAPLRLDIADVDEKLGHLCCLAAADLLVDGLAYAEVAALIAETLVRLVQSPELPASACRPDCRPAVPAPSASESLILDWAAEAEQIVRTVRASVPDVAPARTWLRDFPVSIGGARIHDHARPPLPPGTVLESSSDQIIVTTGSGLVAISGIRDLIGPLDPGLLAPGLRLGVDPQAEVLSLRRRVSDLEEVVTWLARDARQGGGTA